MNQPEQTRTVQDGDKTLTVEVKRDGRLRTTVRWAIHGDHVTVRVPKFMHKREIDNILDKDLIPKILKQRRRSTRLNDDELNARAKHINHRYFDGEITWHSIRWVSNMHKRLGSFTTGGTTDGDIRISDRIKSWPAYVVDYVIAHELAHRIHPNHSRAFWDYLARYPMTERARGFIEGVAYAEGGDPDDLL
jgi:predicted metal-dependent hydrolase